MEDQNPDQNGKGRRYETSTGWWFQPMLRINWGSRRKKPCQLATVSLARPMQNARSLCLCWSLWLGAQVCMPPSACPIRQKMCNNQNLSKWFIMMQFQNASEMSFTPGSSKPCRASSPLHLQHACNLANAPVATVPDIVRNPLLSTCCASTMLQAMEAGDRCLLQHISLIFLSIPQLWSRTSNVHVRRIAQ
jgi:hypothetical protein